MEMVKDLPEWVNHEIGKYEANLRSRQIVGFIAPLYTIESGIASLSEEQRAIATERVMQIGIEQLQEMKREGRTPLEDYHFFSGNIATYLQNIRHAFPDKNSYRNHISMNLALLVAETKSPLATGILNDCREIEKDWESYRELYD